MPDTLLAWLLVDSLAEPDARSATVLVGELVDADDNLSEDTKQFIARHIALARSGRLRRRCGATPEPTRGVERPVHEAKKSPSVAGAFGARTGWRGVGVLRVSRSLAS
jgi:hypothetical protein